MSDKITTGIDNLDRMLVDNEGIPEGYILSLVSPAASNAERFLYQFIAENEDKQAIYITTEQTESFLRNMFSRLGILNQPPQIVDVTSESQPIREIEGYFQKIPDNSLIVIDSVDVLEKTDRQTYQGFLNTLQQYLEESNSTVILYGTNGSEPEFRPLTMKLSDAIFEVDVEKQGEEVISYLSISKFRGLKGVDERIRLQINKDKVSIDTSRDIA